ncbi:MAG: hypothetical protein Q8O92_14290 [Candidatus Latescibacter sp.]|nr:hypothetical protein [Candidatus Latescibacter sp.]
MIKTILLLSGGLDSTLAGKILLEMGIAVEGLNFVSPFCRCTPVSAGCSSASRAAEQLGIPVKTISCVEDYLKVICNPRHGRGSGANACIDCRIFMFSKAREEMAASGASFVTTGEVLGERPMSQRKRAMEIIERESGLEGYVLRPLSAKLLTPTVPEKENLVDREKLLAIQGRRRLPQFALARELGIVDYLCPGGGCLLNDPEFAVRFKDYMEHEGEISVREANLLKLGRHFRLPSGAKVIVGRNEQENLSLERFLMPGDVIIEPYDTPGPSVLCRKPAEPDDISLALRFAASYTKFGEKVNFSVIVIDNNNQRRKTTLAENSMPLERERIAEWWIGAEQSRPFVGQQRY